MSAQSFITHRMFVAALSYETPAASAEVRGPARQSPQADSSATRSSFEARTPRQPVAGVLLANAMLNGYQPTAS